MERRHAAGARSFAVLVAVVAASAVPGCFGSSSSGPPAADAGFGFDSPVSFDSGSVPDVGQGSCSTGWVQASDGNCYVSLAGKWSASTDANTDGPDTVAKLGSANALSASIEQAHTGTDYADCGCNAQHLVIPLGKTFQCQGTTLEFQYDTTTVQTTTNVPGLDIRFCTGPCPGADGGAATFYTGPQYVGSPFAPATSSCGYEWENDAGTASLNKFPASAKITQGQKTSIALGSYVAPGAADNCTGSFDTLDVHVQVYNCAAAETGTDTLSYLRVY